MWREKHRTSSQAWNPPSIADIGVLYYNNVKIAEDWLRKPDIQQRGEEAEELELLGPEQF